MVHGIMLLEATLALYGIAGIIFLWSLLASSERGTRTASVPAILGVVTHTAGLVTIGLAMGAMPFASFFGSLVFMAWSLVAVYLIAARSWRITSLGVFVLLAAAAVIAGALTLPKEIDARLLPMLESRWSTVHITSGLVSYAGFFLAFGSALAYGLQERLLKRKRINSLQKHLPSLDVLDQFAYRIVAFSFLMLTFSLATGAIWAQSVRGSFLSWDAKEVWAGITWLVYAAYLHTRVVQGRRGKWANRLLLAGFICILATYLGINLLSDSWHSYN